MNKQLLQRALDALEKNLQSLVFGVTFDMTQAAIAELRAAIDAVAPCHMPDAGNMVAQPAQVPDENALYDVIRGFGYTTKGQTREIVDAVMAMMAAAPSKKEKAE